MLLHPTVIVAVLSPSTDSTEAFDRGEKFRRYRTWLPTLQDYMLVAQDQPMIDHYHRAADDRWELAPCDGLDTQLRLEGIGCTVPLAAVYERIVFPSRDEA